MKRADRITGAVFLVFSLVALFESSKLPLADRSAPGQGFFPFWVSLTMVVLSALLLLAGLRRTTPNDPGITWPTRRGIFRIVAAFASLLVYIYLVSVVGYILSTLAFLWLLVGLFGSYPWYWSAGLGSTTAVLLYLVFQVWLGVQLPTGLLIIP